MDKCDDCPVRFLGDPCYSKTTGVQRYCELAAEEARDGVSVYRRVIYERSVGQQAPPVQQAAAESANTPETNAHLQLTNLRLFVISRCPAKGQQVTGGCNCTYACSRGYGWFAAGEVTLNECMACVSGNPPRPRNV